MFFRARPKVFLSAEGFSLLRRRDENCLELEGVEFGEIYDIVIGREWAGYIALRLGKDSRALYYLGEIGYRIEGKFRGKRLSQRALLLLRSYFLQMGISSLVITTNVDNIASRKICEGLRCELEGIVDVPEDQIFNCSGARQKCRYIWRL